MRILVHEMVTGGGLADRPLPVGLVREGAAMVHALLADLAELPGLGTRVTCDPRLRLPALPGVEVVSLGPGAEARLDRLLAESDAVWPIAPETAGALEALTRRVEDAGRAVLGSSAAAIAGTADKAALVRALDAAGIPTPATRLLVPDEDPRPAARELGFPLVVKPARGAACQGVSLVRGPLRLPAAVAHAAAVSPGGAVLLQRRVAGVAASVTLLADGTRAAPLVTHRQHVRLGPCSHYSGGETPLRHPLARRAAETAAAVCALFPGLRGLVGVDLVLTTRAAVVIELNPRITTAYLGARAALGVNLAALGLAACSGTLPDLPPVRRRVHFTSGGVLRGDWEAA